MKTITRNTLLAMAIGLTLSTAALSQPDGSGTESQTGPCDGHGPHQRGHWVDPERRNEAKLDRMATRLNLTAEQKDQVGAIMEEARAEGAARREATQKRIAAVLTPEQLAQFEQWPEPRDPGKRGAPPPPPNDGL